MSESTDGLQTDAANHRFADMSGQVAVVTGSSTGIGRAIALEFARAGADVVVNCRSSIAAGEEVVASIREIGRRAELVTADVGSGETSLFEFIETATTVLDRCDVWVNNAGVDLLTGDAASLGYAEKLARLFEVDVRSAVILGRRVGEFFQEQGHGVILNIGWDQADRGMDGLSGELFATSKNAVMGFTRSLAVSLAPNVRVNCIAPGWIRTAWGNEASDAWQDRVRRETPLDRWGTPEDIANAARFLCSSHAAYITGQIVNVNGGAVR